MEGWLIVIAVEVLVASTGGVQFTFVPQQPIVITQPAVYQCSVDTESISLQWHVNETISTSSFITNQGIVTEGVGTQNSKLTIPGDPTLNETKVTCIGSGVVNGKHYINTSSAVLYIQGPPDHPITTCSFVGKYNVKCNWTVPYTINGVDIEWYDCKITRGNNVLLQKEVNSDEVLEIEYVKGTYNLSVAAVIRQNITGKVNTISMSDKDIVCDYSFALEFVKLNGKWMANIAVNVTDIEQFSEIYPTLMYVTACPISSSQSCNSNESNFAKSEGLMKHKVIIELKEKEVRNITVFVNYDSGLNVISNYHPIISTFDVQKLNITESVSSRQVCFSCSYFEESSVKGCFICYTNLQFNFSGNLSIPKTKHIQCVSDIITGDYSILVYDYESDGTVFTNTPAISISSTRINVISASTSPISSELSSFSLLLLLTTSRASSLPTTLSKPNGMIAVLVAVSVTGGVVLVCIIVATVSVILVFCVQHNNNKSKERTIFKSTNVFYSEATVNINEPTVEDNPCYELVTKTIHMDSANYNEHVCGGLSVDDNPCYGMIGR